jgi:hypothetical protein
VLEEVGAVTKLMLVYYSWVVTFRALLDAEHRGAEVRVCQVCTVNTDKQKIATLW